jgi:hypothetical protein
MLSAGGQVLWQEESILQVRWRIQNDTCICGQTFDPQSAPDDLVSCIVIAETGYLVVVTAEQFMINEYWQGRRRVFFGDVVNSEEI